MQLGKFSGWVGHERLDHVLKEVRLYSFVPKSTLQLCTHCLSGTARVQTCAYASVVGCSCLEESRIHPVSWRWFHKIPRCRSRFQPTLHSKKSHHARPSAKKKATGNITMLFASLHGLVGGVDCDIIVNASQIHCCAVLVPVSVPSSCLSTGGHTVWVVFPFPPSPPPSLSIYDSLVKRTSRVVRIQASARGRVPSPSSFLYLSCCMLGGAV